MIQYAIALTVFAVAAVAETPLLSLVDPGSKMIAGIHVDRTLSSSLGSFLVSQLNDDDPGFKKFVEETGFDPRVHVREVVMASADAGRKNGFIAARGVFDGPRILAAAQAHGGTAVSYSGVSAVASKEGQWLAIVDGSLALMGDQALVKYALDHRRDTAAPTFALGRKASELSLKHDGWLVANGAITPPSPARGTPMPSGAALAGIVQTSGGIDFGSLVRVTGEALTRSEKDAQALVDVIRFVTTMARNSMDRNPEARKLEPVLNTLDVKAVASTVTLSFAVPEADLRELITPKNRKTQRAAARP
jgi:hypothetical protein